MALTVLVAILMLVAILGTGILIALLIERIFDLDSY
jgi:predicted permease